MAFMFLICNDRYHVISRIHDWFKLKWLWALGTENSYGHYYSPYIRSDPSSGDDSLGIIYSYYIPSIRIHIVFVKSGKGFISDVVFWRLFYHLYCMQFIFIIQVYNHLYFSNTLFSVRQGRQRFHLSRRTASRDDKSRREINGRGSGRDDPGSGYRWGWTDQL